MDKNSDRDPIVWNLFGQTEVIDHLWQFMRVSFQLKQFQNSKIDSSEGIFVENFKFLRGHVELGRYVGRQVGVNGELKFYVKYQHRHQTTLHSCCSGGAWG